MTRFICFLELNGSRVSSPLPRRCDAMLCPPHSSTSLEGAGGRPQQSWPRECGAAQYIRCRHRRTCKRLPGHDTWSKWPVNSSSEVKPLHVCVMCVRPNPVISNHLFPRASPSATLRSAHTRVAPAPPFPSGPATPHAGRNKKKRRAWRGETPHARLGLRAPRPPPSLPPPT